MVRKSKKFGIRTLVNTTPTDTGDYADIEYISNGGEHLVIEAKSNETPDAPNTVYKIFGQLLAELGKSNSHRILGTPVLAVLIPDDVPVAKGAPKEIGSVYYRRRFRMIPREKYIDYGKLVGVQYVFCCARGNYVNVYLWEDFWDGKEPVERIQ